MEVELQKILYYETKEGKSPYFEWLSDFEYKTKAMIESRVDRLRFGNFGDHKVLGGGLFELRIHFGPGYRIYFGRQGREIVVLLTGGVKRMQAWDIMRAKHYWSDYMERKK